MRISEFHNELLRQGRVPVEKVGHNKGIRRAWRADRRTNTEAKAMADAAEDLAWQMEEIDKNTERLLNAIFGESND